METVEFKKSGGQITVDITSGYAQPGSYYFILWEANSNSVALEKRGNFINKEDDIISLPTPSLINNERIIDLGIKLSIIPPQDNYNIQVKLFQDGNTIGYVTQEGSTEGRYQNVQIFIQLKCEEA